MVRIYARHNASFRLQQSSSLRNIVCKLLVQIRCRNKNRLETNAVFSCHRFFARWLLRYAKTFCGVMTSSNSVFVILYRWLHSVVTWPHVLSSCCNLRARMLVKVLRLLSDILLFWCLQKAKEISLNGNFPSGRRQSSRRLQRGYGFSMSTSKS